MPQGSSRIAGSEDKDKGQARGVVTGVGGKAAEVTAELISEANWGQSQAAVGGTTQGGCARTRVCACVCACVCYVITEKLTRISEDSGITLGHKKD